MTNRRPDLMLIVICFLILMWAVDFVSDWRSASGLDRIRTTLIDRCEDRNRADRDTVSDLQARIDLYAAIIEMERVNEIADPGIRARRIAAYTEAQTQAQVRLQGVPAPQNCRQVFADGL